MREVVRLVQLAADCHYRAHLAKSPEQRAELTEAASEWEQLAESRRLDRN